MFNIRIGPQEESQEQPKTFIVKLINRKACIREAIDDETNLIEKCGARYSSEDCGCHPGYCQECRLEVHHISFTMPGYREQSSLLNYCSAKGNH